MHDLGTLRNLLVHNAKETNFTFAEYFRNGDLKRKFCAAFGHGLGDDSGPQAQSHAQFVEANPRFSVFRDVVRIALYVDGEQKKVAAEDVLKRALDNLQRAMSALPPA